MRIALVISIIFNVGLAWLAFHNYRMWLITQVNHARMAEKSAVEHFSNGFNYAWMQMREEAEKTEKMTLAAEKAAKKAAQG